jgi:hypothetical protein
VMTACPLTCLLDFRHILALSIAVIMDYFVNTRFATG